MMTTKTMGQEYSTPKEYIQARVGVRLIEEKEEDTTLEDKLAELVNHLEQVVLPREIEVFLAGLSKRELEIIDEHVQKNKNVNEA